MLLLLPFSGSSQTVDSLQVDSVKKDTTYILHSESKSETPTNSTAALTDTLQKSHSVRKATLLSTLLPGAGQVYNKKVWKVPIIYAAFGSLVYLIKFNSDRFNTYENALLYRYDDDPATIDAYQGLYSDDNLKSLRDFYRRNRDLSFVGVSLVYVLNIIDAHVDAHLFNFNVDDNLSLNWSPVMNPAPGYAQAGISLHLTF